MNHFLKIKTFLNFFNFKSKQRKRKVKMSHSLKIYFIILLVVLRQSKSNESHVVFRFNYFGHTRSVSIDEAIKIFLEKKLEYELRIKEEYERKIYNNYLANRIQSSILRDFLTMRY